VVKSSCHRYMDLITQVSQNLFWSTTCQCDSSSSCIKSLE